MTSRLSSVLLLILCIIPAFSLHTCVHDSIEHEMSELKFVPESRSNGYHSIRFVPDYSFLGVGSSDAADRNCAQAGDSFKIGNPSDPSVVCDSTHTDNCLCITHVFSINSFLFFFSVGWGTCETADVLTADQKTFLEDTVFPWVFQKLEAVFRVADFSGSEIFFYFLPETQIPSSPVVVVTSM